MSILRRQGRFSNKLGECHEHKRYGNYIVEKIEDCHEHKRGGNYTDEKIGDVDEHKGERNYIVDTGI